MQGDAVGEGACACAFARAGARGHPPRAPRTPPRLTLAGRPDAQLDVGRGLQAAQLGEQARAEAAAGGGAAGEHDVLQQRGAQVKVGAQRGARGELGHAAALEAA
jgi:hypothetical protein